MFLKLLMQGRLTRNPEVFQKHEGEREIDWARYTIAVNRGRAVAGKPTADYFYCVVFGKSKVEYASKYLKKGALVFVIGRPRQDSYINKEGNKIFTTTLFVQEQEFLRIPQKTEGPVQQQMPEKAPTGEMQEQSESAEETLVFEQEAFTDLEDFYPNYLEQYQDYGEELPRP